MFDFYVAGIALVVLCLIFATAWYLDLRRGAKAAREKKANQARAAAINDFVTHFDALLADQEDEIKLMRQTLLERAKQLLEDGREQK